MVLENIDEYAIFLLDREGRVITWNAGARSIKGYRDDEILGRSFDCFYTPEDVKAGRPWRLLEAARARGKARDEGWRVRKDGSRFWAHVVISALRDEAGALVGFAKVTSDMTERRRAELGLAARAGQQAAIAEFGLHALGTTDLQSVMDRACEVGAHTLGASACGIFEQQPGGTTLRLRAGQGYRRDAGDVIAGAGRGSQLGLALLGDGAVSVEDARADGRFAGDDLFERLGLVSALLAVIHAPGHKTRAYGVLAVHDTRARHHSQDDIHFVVSLANLVAAAIARKHTEQALEDTRARAFEEFTLKVKAQHDVRQRDEFIAVAAHELRTPLTALQLKLQLLGRALAKVSPDAARPGEEPANSQPGERVRWPPDEAMALSIRNGFQGVTGQTERLMRLVERLLDVSRIAEGRLQLSVQELDAVALVRRVTDELGADAARAGSEIRFRGEGAVKGWWDAARLEEVVSNLLSNAIKYGERKPIEVEVAGGDVMATITIRDGGIGIPAGEDERIFGRFERAVSPRRYGGLGLGLYVTRALVEAHGGRIRVASRPGEGATFSVELPLGHATAAGAGDDATAAAAPPPQP